MKAVSLKILPEDNNGIGVSTIYAEDVEKYETALLDKNGAHPVERYELAYEAISGHEKWIKKSLEVKDIIRLGIEGVPNKEVTLVKAKKEDYSENHICLFGLGSFTSLSSILSINDVKDLEEISLE